MSSNAFSPALFKATKCLLVSSIPMRSTCIGRANISRAATVPLRAFGTSSVHTNSKSTRTSSPPSYSILDASPCWMNHVASSVPSNRSFSTRSDVADVPSPVATPATGLRVYVHPLSQLVLQYFQTHAHDWITKQRLDASLSIQRDGTFVLEYPDGKARIWTYYDPMGMKYWLLYGSTRQNVDQRQYQFLLQDNLTPDEWSSYKTVANTTNNAKSQTASDTLVADIFASVKELIRTVNEIKYTVPRIK